MAKSLAGALLQKGQGETVNQANLYFLDSWVSGRQRAGWERSMVCSQPLQFYAVAGGVGGPDAGDLAAETILTVLDQEQRRQDRRDFSFAEFTQAYLDRAGRVVGRLLEPLFGQLVGASLALLVLDKTAAYTVSIGPSQAYLLREGQLFNLSQSDALRDSRLLGPGTEAVRADNMTRTDLLPGDMFFLATAGVTDVLARATLEDLLGRPQPFFEKARLIGNAVRQAGGRADLALLVLRVLDPHGHTEPDLAQGRGKKKLRQARPAMRQSEVWQQEVRQYRWLRPLLIFLVFLLLGALAGKFIFVLLGWLLRLRFSS